MNLLSDLVDLILPASCVCCGRPGSIWCLDCQPAGVAGPVTLAHGPPTVAAGEYADELRTVLLHYKERGKRQLAIRLADYLAEAVDVAAQADGAPLLVPIPSRRAAARERGGDHVRRLTRIVARHTGATALPLLGLTGRVADSAGLTPAQRQANLAGRMRAAPPAEPRIGIHMQVILLDDIVTTGTTLAEADRALAAAGWQRRAAAVIAATPRRHPSDAGAGSVPSDGATDISAQPPDRSSGRGNHSKNDVDAEEILGNFNWAEQEKGSTVCRTNRR